MTEKMENPFEKYHRKSEEYNKNLRDKIFTANAGGVVAMLSFVGVSLSNGREVHGKFSLAMFLIGVSSSLLSYFYSSLYEIYNSIRFHDLDDQIRRHYMINPEKSFNKIPYNPQNTIGKMKFLKLIMNIPRGKPSKILSEDENEFFSYIGNMESTFDIIALLCFLIGSTSGFILVIMI